MLLMIRKYICESKVSLSKQSFFYSAIWNADVQNDLISKCNDKSQLFQGNRKSLKVAMLGLPNAGKSTLVNKLTQRSLCPTSSKVHTTMHKAEAIYTEGDTQIIFMDTPGLVTSSTLKTYKLKKTFKEDPENSVSEADVIGIIQDVTNVYTRHKIDDFVLDCLKNKRQDANLLMIFNKVDKLKKKHPLLDLARLLTTNEKYPKFDDVFMVSALTGDGVDDLRNYLYDAAKVRDWNYKEELYTNQPTTTIIEQTVRAKLMDILPSEMPYNVQIKTEYLNIRDDGSVKSVVLVDCPNTRYVKVLLKHKAFKTKCLSHYAEQELSHAFRTNVAVKINVQCTKAQSTQSN